MKIKNGNKSGHKLKENSTEKSAGMDLRANIEKGIELKPLRKVLIPSGLFLEIPEGYKAQIWPGSGRAINRGSTALNSPGIIDGDYRREECIILINLSEEKYVIKVSEKICQKIIDRHEKALWIKTDKLENTNRGNRSFEHTGKK